MSPSHKGNPGISRRMATIALRKLEGRRGGLLLAKPRGDVCILRDEASKGYCVRICGTSEFIGACATREEAESMAAKYLAEHRSIHRPESCPCYAEDVKRSHR